MFVVFVDLAIAGCRRLPRARAQARRLEPPRDRRDARRPGRHVRAGDRAGVLVHAACTAGSWRVAGVADLARRLRRGGCGRHGGRGDRRIQLLSPVPQPPAVFLIYGLVSMVLVTTSRGSYVVLLNSQQRASHQAVPVLLYGAGRHGVAAASELFDESGAGLRPIGFMDDDPGKTGRLVNGLPVLGTLVRARESLIAAHGVKAVVIASTMLADR